MFHVKATGILEYRVSIMEDYIMSRTIKKEETIVTDWHGVLREINKIGVFGAKKIKTIQIKKPFLDKPQEYMITINTVEEKDE